MQVEVLLHGVLIRHAGRERLQLDCPPDSSIQAVLELLAAQVPAMETELARCACALGNKLVKRDQPLPADVPLALIPPVSGG